MVTFQEAQQIIIGIAGSFGQETVFLDDAFGRIIAEPVIADRDYPPFNRAAMDGYALCIKDLESGIRTFSVAETIFAGQASQKRLAVNQCYKIMTGAAIPVPADIIIRKEDTLPDGNEVQVSINHFHPYQHIAQMGEDIKNGAGVVTASRLCTAPVISALAAMGKHEITVFGLPLVAIFTTGNEVVALNKPVNAFQIRNSNMHLFKALFKKWQIVPALTEHIPDDKADLHQAFSKAMQADIIVISGGVSAGDADYVPEVLESLGVKKLFHKVAIKPGKPFWCGLTPNHGLVFALPGNPFSSLVTFVLFVETYLRHCFGFEEQKITKLPFYGSRKNKSSLDEFFPVKLQASPVAAIPLSFNSSGDILAALHADGIMHHPASRNEVSDGDELMYSPIHSISL